MGVVAVIGMAALVIASFVVGARELMRFDDSTPAPAIRTTDATIAIVGSITLSDGYFKCAPGAECVGRPGVGDIRSGATVVISDGAGNVLGSTVLSKGVRDKPTARCLFMFSTTVPAGLGSYLIGIGDRAEYRVSETRVGSRVDLLLGDDQTGETILHSMPGATPRYSDV